MTFKSLASETTYYMTVRCDDGTSKEYTRTAFGEWCEVIAYKSHCSDDLALVSHPLAVELEDIFVKNHL